MATNASELFIVIAQMSVAFAGFGSLASRLGQQSGGDDARVDATRLNLMLFASLSVTVLGILPSTLSGLTVDDQLAIRLSALAALFAIVVYAVTGVSRALSLRQTLGFSMTGVLSNLACTVIACAAFTFCVLDFPQGRTEAVYLLGLVALLGSSIIMFSRVIASMLRPHNRSGE